MSASPSEHIATTQAPRVALRVRLREESKPGAVDGAWWPQSRNLRTEAADLVDHFPDPTRRIHRLLFSRPDWDDGVVESRGVRAIRARRGVIKVGSFPSDDTHLMILTMGSGQRLRLLVVPSDAEPTSAERTMRAACEEDAQPADSTAADHRRWDDDGAGS